MCGRGGRVEGGGGGGLVASAMRDEAKLISRNSQKVPTARGTPGPLHQLWQLVIADCIVQQRHLSLSLSLSLSNSRHWFTTSFLQPLPYFVTP